MTTTSSLYATVRTRLLELAAELDESRHDTPVPTLPLWTIRDTYAHLAGVADDGLAGNTAGAGTPEWTGKQVSDRAGSTLAELCAEWERNAEAIDAVIRDGGPTTFALDAWHHEQDLRSMLDLPVDRDDQHVRFILDATTALVNSVWNPDFATTRLAPSDLDGEWQLGKGNPATTVNATGYELARALVGRRSRAQVEAMGWDDPAPHIDTLPAFAFADRDIVEV